MFLLAGGILLEIQTASRTSSSKLHPTAGAWSKAQSEALGNLSLQENHEQDLPCGDSNIALRFQMAKWCHPSDGSVQTLSSIQHDLGIQSAEIK